jgi:hypothetical protein
MKLLGMPYSVVFKGVRHVLVPMSSALYLEKGMEACVHSGTLSICSFALLRVFNEKRDHIGHTFIHQGFEKLILKGDPKHTYQLQSLLRARSTKWVGGDTFDSLRDVLGSGYGIPAKDCNSLDSPAEKAKSGVSFATIWVDKGGTANAVEYKMSAFTQDQDPGPVKLL